MVVLLVARWTLVVPARSLFAWKVALPSAMVGVVVLVPAVPPPTVGVVLLKLSPLALLPVEAIGAAAALLVEPAARLVGRGHDMGGRGR